jgi:plasmid maintenance system antidote protein VapI
MKASKKINIVLSELDIKAPTLAKKIGVQYSRIAALQYDRTKKISGDLANKINAVYPQFPIDWLLSGSESIPQKHDERVMNIVSKMNLPPQDVEVLKDYALEVGTRLEYILFLMDKVAEEKATEKVDFKIKALENIIKTQEKTMSILENTINLYKEQIEILESKIKPPTTPKKQEKTAKNTPKTKKKTPKK